MTIESNTKNPVIPTPDEMDRNPAVSFWLKRNWRMAYDRDPLDAARDAADLHQLCDDRLVKILSEGICDE